MLQHGQKAPTQLECTHNIASKMKLQSSYKLRRCLFTKVHRFITRWIFYGSLYVTVRNLSMRMSPAATNNTTHRNYLGEASNKVPAILDGVGVFPPMFNVGLFSCWRNSTTFQKSYKGHEKVDKNAFLSDRHVIYVMGIMGSTWNPYKCWSNSWSILFDS